MGLHSKAQILEAYRLFAKTILMHISHGELFIKPSFYYVMGSHIRLVEGSSPFGLTSGWILALLVGKLIWYTSVI